MSNFFKKKTGSVVDPVEAAAISAPVPAAPVAASPATESLPPAPAPSQAPATVLAPAKAPREAKVKVGKNVSLHGQFTFLPAGAIISEGSYGPGIFEKLAEAGVELEPLG